MQEVSYYHAGNDVPTCLHESFSIQFMERRMRIYIDTLCKIGSFEESDVHLFINIGPFPSPVYGVIYLTSGRILELHILDMPRAIDVAMRSLCPVKPEQLMRSSHVQQ